MRDRLRHAASAAFVCGAAMLSGLADGRVWAQAGRPAPVADRNPREVAAYLQGIERLRSGCGNAAWTLWYSNSYGDWRKRRSSVLSMNYSAAFFPALPPAPGELAEPLRIQVGDAMTGANDLLRESGTLFKQLADYVNAKDYEGDRFGKGDALNGRLLEIGKACHESHATLTRLYVEIAEGLIEKGRAGSARPDAVATMTADWRRARELSAELSKGPAASMARMETLVAELSALADERRRTMLDADGQGARGWVDRFYDKVLNERVAIPMRKLLREVKGDRRALAEASADRPRNTFWSVRGEIDHQMPDAILSFMRAAR